MMMRTPSPPCPLLQMIPARVIAAACQISMRSLTRAIAKGQFPAPICIRGRKFFLASDINRWLEVLHGPGDVPPQGDSQAPTGSAR